MKRLISLAIFVFILNTSCSQKINESEVPIVVIESFNNNFKGANLKNWDIEKDGSYEAEFDFNNKETSATFSVDGKLLETEQEIEKSTMPISIRDYLSKNYSGKNISEVAKITTVNATVMYEVEIDGKDLMFDEKGNFIN